MVVLPVIKLKRESVKEARAKLPLPLRILTSPKTTAVLATVLGALAFPAVAARVAVGAARVVGKKIGKIGIGTALLIPSTYQLLKTSPTAKEAAVGVLKGEPGKVVAGYIEKAPPSVKEKAATLGAVGLVGAGVVGAVAVIAPKVKELLPGKKAPAPEKQLVPETMPTMEDMPVTPETTTITTGKKPTRRRRATKVQPVIQYVNLRINNRATGIRIRN